MTEDSFVIMCKKVGRYYEENYDFSNIMRIGYEL